MSVDLETVTLQGTYRIGFMPPAEHSLAAGELYIEVGSGAPKLWVGAMEEAGMVGNMAVFAIAGPAAEMYGPPAPPPKAEPQDEPKDDEPKTKRGR